MTTRTVVLAALLALAAAPAALAASGPEPLRLSLSDAVQQALARNLDIAVARLDAPAAAQGVAIADAAFDSRFDASANWGKTKTEPSSLFSPETRETRVGSASWTDPWETGGSLKVGFDYSEMVSTYPSGSGSFGLVPSTMGTSLSVTASQPFLRNFGFSINRIAIEQARTSLKLTEQQFLQRVQSTIETTESAYWTLVGTRRALTVAQSSLQLARDFLQQTKIKVDVGTLPPIEITTAEAEVASREEAVIVAENAIRNGEDVLRAAMRMDEMSVDWNRPITPADEVSFAPVQVDLDRAIGDALERRPEIVEAQLRLRSAQLNEQYKANQIKPDLTVSASLGVSGNNYDFHNITRIERGISSDFCDPESPDGGVLCGTRYALPVTSTVKENQGRTDAFKELTKGTNHDWAVGAVFSLPIGTRAAKADHARARITVEQANLSIDQLRQAVRVEVRQAARDLETAAKRVASVRANVELQKKKVDAEQKRYENGLSIAFRVLQTQTDLQNAEYSEIAAMVDYSKAQSRLARVRGTILEDRGIKLAGAGR